MNQDRRNFMKNTAIAGLGVAAIAAFPTLSAFAEDAPAEEKKPFAWVPTASACKLIEETTNDATPAGTRSFKFTTDGRTCSKWVTFDIVGDERLIANVAYEGGCDGGTQGVSRMAEGRKAEEVVRLLKGVVCYNKKSGSSCPMQLSFGVNQALMIMDGLACPGCDGTICANIK